VIDTAHGEVVRARPGADGYLCARGKFGWDYLASGDRLKAPLVRNGSELEEATWEEALERAAKGLAGAGSVCGLVGPNVTTETVRTFGELLGTVFGSQAVSFTGGGVPFGVLSTFGDLKALAGAADVEKARKILAIGPSLAEGYPRARLAIKRAVAAGAKLIVIDPSDSELTALATLHLKPKPGAEAHVLSAIAKALVEGDLYNAEATQEVGGAADALAEIRGLAVSATGVGDEQIAEAAKLFAKGKGVIVDSAITCATLQRGAGLLLLTGRRKRALLTLHPAANPWAAVTLGAVTSENDAKGLFVLGADPAATGGAPKADFLVVQDVFLTKTAKQADVVLPMRAFAEEEGTVLGAGGKLIPVDAAAPSELPATWETLAGVAAAAGKPLGVKSLRDVRTAVKNVMGAAHGRLAFPAMNGASDPGDLRPYDRFELPEPSWTERSQLGEVRVAPGTTAAQEVTE
jgi:predicted molibdopterin-dependent oxidoreductase YjgC